MAPSDWYRRSRSRCTGWTGERVRPGSAVWLQARLLLSLKLACQLRADQLTGLAEAQLDVAAGDVFTRAEEPAHSSTMDWKPP